MQGLEFRHYHNVNEMLDIKTASPDTDVMVKSLGRQTDGQTYGVQCLTEQETDHSK